MSNVISSFNSFSKSNKPEPKPLKFEGGWNAGPVFEWYNGLTSPQAKSIQLIQIRKDGSGPVPHRFIVLQMCNKDIHRFDRRPDHVNLDRVDLVFNQAVTSEDSYTPNIDYAEEERISEREIELTLGGQVDLMTVISICYAISLDDFAQKYTFLRHNCFFFSWTILTIVSRHHLPYQVPEPQSVMGRFQSGLDQLTSVIVKEAESLFLDIVIESVVRFRETARTSKPEAMGLMGRFGPLVPSSFFRFLWRRSFKIRLAFGLRSQLTRMVKAEMTKVANTVHEATLSNHVAYELLDKHLWIEGTTGAIKEALKTEVSKILWKSVLEAISGGLGDVDPKHLQDQITDPELNSTWLGKNVAELSTVWDAALQGGLRAVKQAGQDVDGLSHDAAFDKAWTAAQAAALTSAQNAVESTRLVLRKPERDAKWRALWSIWEEGWKQAHEDARPRAVAAVEKIAEAVLTAGAGVVVEEMRESRVKTIQAYMPNKSRKWLRRRQRQISDITNAQLQECMQSIIKRNTINAEALTAVHSSMEAIWDKVRTRIQAPAEALGTIVEPGE
ncbi:hypothetical protein FRC12_000179 [Ceratobasidium sp. 428]|nr:hypothetical protein FRC12_000179 [Ceratobasidium sp. 428]